MSVTVARRDLSFEGEKDALLLVRPAWNNYRSLHVFRETFSGPMEKKRMHRNPSGPTKMRKEVRYRLRAPVVFSWEGARYQRFQGEGITRDISVQGAFIVTATTPPAECTIQLDLVLPPLAGLQAVMRIVGRARVTRVDHRSGDDGTSGFAVVTDDRHQWSLTALRSESESGVTAGKNAAVKLDAN